MHMELGRQTHGWSGSIEEFLSTPPSLIEESLLDHMSGLFGHGASDLQVSAWEEEVSLLRNTFRSLSISRPDSLEWSVVFEFEIPLEGGRRPDVLILAPETLLVLEFKQESVITRASVEQVAAYARDLSEYHSESHNLDVKSIVIPTRTLDMRFISENVKGVSPDLLPSELDSLPSGRSPNLSKWLKGDYAPLPTLIAAAKMIFKNERLPAIKRAESSGVWRAVGKLREISRNSRINGEHAMAFVAGVPGAGKTLVGLQFVHEESSEEINSVFLSGNGPLVDVLSGALKSTVFVKDLHGFIKTHGLTVKIPKQHVIVFDEAQRAWDSEHMANKTNVNFSEPDLLVAIGERIPDWSMLVGLIGHGQEINSGEEAGISGWAEAISKSPNRESWRLYVPPRFHSQFASLNTSESPELDLNVSLRSKKADELHTWVENLLEGHISEAAKYAQRMQRNEFNIFVSRNLEECKEYLVERYDGLKDCRYGILASAKDKTLSSFGIENGFFENKRVKYRDWYNNPKGDPGSCCNFEAPMTEFGSQGLELDMALVAWGDDFVWNGKTWIMRKMRTKYPQRDPFTLRKNSYRVLLTRSRDGLVIFVPPLEKFDSTELVLLASGAKPLTKLIQDSKTA